jgi:hypothetical protein
VLPVLVVLAVGCKGKAPEPAASAAPEEPVGAPVSNEEAAQLVAGKWLAVVDAGNYAQSWTEAAMYFKKSIDQRGWEHALTAARQPLGKVLSRKVLSAAYATSLPGAPDGQYVIIRFDSAFEEKRSTIETVTPMKEPDGKWRVSGYFIK